jgi:uncharacterized membrane protein YfcA
VSPESAGYTPPAIILRGILLESFPLVPIPLFYALAIPAVLMVGITKTGVGGSNVLGVSLMSFAVAVPQATAILLPILCLTDLAGVWMFRRSWDARNLAIILPGAVLGIVIGTVTFSYLDSAAIKTVVGVIAVWFALAQFVPLIKKREVAPKPASVPRGFFWSSVAGFTSFVAHAGQPPLSIYLIPQRMPKELYLGTNAIFWAFANYLKLIPFWYLGQLNVTNLATSVALMPLVPVGLAIGWWIQKALSPTMFYKVVLILLGLTGAKLIWDGIASAL